MQLEICLDDIDGARIADRAGADRIELCADLSVGGITPSIGTVAQALNEIKSVGLQVLIRARGGDFTYSPSEVSAMCADISAIRSLPNPHNIRIGFVVGALTPANTIDLDTIAQFKAAAGDSPLTFHKAFDLTSDLHAALNQLIELGFQRVLTSGGKASALEGAAVIKELVAQSAGRMAILAGGGVRAHNLAEIIAATGVTELHMTARQEVASSAQPSEVSGLYDSGKRWVTSESMISEIQQAISAH